MKKSKIVLAIVLAVVLLIAVWNVPTFSWFSRPHSQNGAQAVLGGSNGAYSLNAFKLEAMARGENRVWTREEMEKGNEVIRLAVNRFIDKYEPKH